METQWLNGSPSYSVTLSPAECLEVVTQAATAGAADSADRVRVALAFEWLTWKVSECA